MNSAVAVRVTRLEHRYGDRLALAGVDLEIYAGELFALLGPNGGGKTTLFRLLSTLLPAPSGHVTVLGCNLPEQADRLRAVMGVVFQSPSLDRKLTVRENLHHQGHLYGLAGQPLRRRADEMLARLGVADRARDPVETLSGGLRRRVEIAKSLLHAPKLLLMDEPSTGLDPGARSDLWRYLRQLRDEEGVTIALTTHLLEEADKADRIAIVDAGQIVALDAPDKLRATVGGDAMTIEASDPVALAADIAARFGLAPRVVEGGVRLESPQGHRLVARIVEAFPGRITSITLGKPTLEDVFIARTGHRFWQAERGPAGA